MYTQLKQIKQKVLMAAALPAAALLLAGCPYPDGGTTPQMEYDAGFVVGFAQDDEYWQGFEDSYDTVDGGEIFYSGDLIPVLDEISYDAGYYDGTWYAYNDGYFVAYDYAFAIGFSEGYDVAFNSNWRAFLIADEHVEWLDGGFSDGYNDGFSEGRILGASDYIDGLAYDWLDALLWYQDVDAEGNPNDVYFEDLDLGTGEFGPVVLYEYGTNPHDLVKAIRAPRKGREFTPAIRGAGSKALAKQAELPELSYRALTTEVQQELNVNPATSPRSDYVLTLESSWLDRVNAYNAAYNKKSAVERKSVK
jgi:hypothetical protein